MKFKKGSRIVVDLKKDGIWIGTVKAAGKNIKVRFDDGDEMSFTANDKAILGEGIKKKNKKEIAKKDLKKWLVGSKKDKKETGKKEDKKKAGKKKSGRGKGLTAKNISFKGCDTPIEEVMGKKKLASGEMVKKIWDYVKANDLRE